VIAVRRAREEVGRIMCSTSILEIRPPKVAPSRRDATQDNQAVAFAPSVQHAISGSKDSADMDTSSAGGTIPS